MNPDYSTTAQSAFESATKTESGLVCGTKTKFVCPFPSCRTYAVQHWGNHLNPVQIHSGGHYPRQTGDLVPLCTSRCEACNQEAIYIGGKIAFPADSDAPMPAADLPTDCIADFQEAREILPRSPRGSSALLRLVLQKLLPHLGATKSKIDSAIGELVAAGKIKEPIQKALDIVRVIGNESVHPGEMDLQDDRDTALGLFRIINLIVETEITEPKRLNALYTSLPKSKLDGIANRDGKAAQP
ncbi:DUF4145 domain-containing protein [Alteriqipengyuania lutimaris]|uniref:DUF4145 domain-containing protein n=1 Tax=Alteriqipengyuania lutimaris TaxID=1538146 RepID=A0A395LQL9_9SPHN|nr:DUF4145 domain-containing protein [Alteriqipengyuania lutimaris]MBB3034093.1 hypothetical protein [Alteriqipengyuania lutimaris]RDS76970.1 DUF4145 domain-containing protein [Alteriqipengyuania lutimaris]